MMNLDPQSLAKTDPLLRDALLNLQGNEKLRVVMSLGQEIGEKLTTQPLTPSQFPSRQAYREALIAKRKQELAQGKVGQTLEALKNLSLTPRGGTTSSVVVVEGTANQILQSLKLSGIRSATLDQVIRIEPIPIDPKMVDHLVNLTLKILPGDKEQIYRASQQYVRTYCKSYGTVQVLGMRNRVSLDEIFTKVKLLQEIENLKIADLQTIENYIRNSKNNQFKNENYYKESGKKIANKEQYLMVLGAPGSGKSTFLRKIGLEAFKGDDGDFKQFLIPVLIELKQFNQQEINFTKIISQRLKNAGFLKPEDYTDKALSSGNIFVILDGLDEVSSNNISQVINAIQKLVTTYRNNRFIISSRTAAYRNNFSNFYCVEIADFDDEQIKKFINNWFQSELDQRARTASRCWEELENNPGAKELAKTPLLLTFICLVYDQSQSLPKIRSILYREALQILLKKWAAEKRLELAPIYQGFTPELEEILLAEIAYNAFEKDQLLFNEQEITNQIKTFLSKNLNAPQEINGEATLNAITIQQGILVERAEKIYSFSHLTLQEYLTAQYIVNNNLIEQLVINHVTDVRWKEVFLLVAGLMQETTGTDRLLLLMEKQALSYLNTPTGKNCLIPLLRWAEYVTTDWGTEQVPHLPFGLKTVIKRAVAIAYANVNTNAKTYAYANCNAYPYLYANAYANSYANVYAIVYANRNPYAYAYANAYAYAIDEFMNIAHELEKLPMIFQNVDLKALIAKLEFLKSKIPNFNTTEQYRQEFRQNILKTWLEAFHLTPEILNLSEENISKIDQHYFYIYYLILECKDAAVRVTFQTWESIENRMFRIVDFEKELL